jgi:hypothetical protein
MKHVHIGDVLNFDLCDLQKIGQIKNPGIMLCIIIRYTYDKNLEMIQTLVQEFVGFPKWLPGGHMIFEVRSRRN